AIMQGLDLDLYVLGRGWHGQKGLKVDPTNAMSPTYDKKTAHEATLGLRAKQKIKLFDYRFEGGLQAGKRPGAAPVATAMPVATVQKAVNVLAYQVDLELGLNLLEDRVRIAVEGLYASG